MNRDQLLCGEVWRKGDRPLSGEFSDLVDEVRLTQEMEDVARATAEIMPPILDGVGAESGGGCDRMDAGFAMVAIRVVRHPATAIFHRFQGELAQTVNAMGSQCKFLLNVGRIQIKQF